MRKESIIDIKNGNVYGGAKEDTSNKGGTWQGPYDRSGI